MKISKIRTTWIMLRSGVFTARMCFLVWFHATFNRKHFRPKLDSMLRYWARTVLKFVNADWQVTLHNTFEFEPGKQYILMSNHMSLYDIPLIYVALPGSIRMLSKRELMRVPFLGKAMKIGSFPVIDRHNRQQALQDLDYAKQLMQDGIIVWMAPEGTRSRTGELLPFKKGGFMLALQTGASIVPIGIKNANKILPKQTWQFSTHENVEVHVGKPIDASQYSLETRDELMEAVRTEMLKLLS
ncbi:MAG: 1-acyl-sn-glycerol-3-phosphate acyltransferase [Legionellales bacterium]|nr:1-acyl-sn-glycerol-3-phosphate acyltransferase [Legionellales bacterium]